MGSRIGNGEKLYNCGHSLDENKWVSTTLTLLLETGGGIGLGRFLIELQLIPTILSVGVVGQNACFLCELL
jgi:hypothetical protein